MRALWVAPLVLTLACASGYASIASDQEPGREHMDARVREALKAAEACLHWAGEDGYSPERATEVETGARESCNHARELAGETRRALTPAQDAVLTIVLEGETPERCARVPSQGEASSLLAEARARCARFQR